MLKKMNLPNKLTMLRIILVPVFVLFLCIPKEFFELIKCPDVHNYMGYVALVIFIIAAITDTLDGRISRKNNIVTKFGKIMDPLADKLLVSTGFIMLTGLGVIPAYVTAIVVFRDFFVNALRMFGSDNSKDVAAGISGKIKTVFQMLAIAIGLFSFSYAPDYGLFSFIESSVKMNMLELVTNISLSVVVLGVIVATLWSFVDYFLRFKEDIDVEH